MMNKRDWLILVFPVFIFLFGNFFFFGLDNLALIKTIIWYYTLCLFGPLFYLLVAPYSSVIKKWGYSFSKSLGLLVLFLDVWLGSYLGLPLYSFYGILLLLVLWLLVSIIIGQKSPLKIDIEEVYLSEIIFLFAFIFILIINSLHPEIYWGEKPMDFSILNFMARTEQVPIQDVWAYGHEMKYYYFGYLIWGGFFKLTSIPVDVGYHLSIASVTGLFAQNAYGLFRYLFKRKRSSIIAALALTFGANWAAASFLLTGRVANMRAFWESTRVFRQNNFAEYPSWSFLFFDLHPHVMALPFCLLFIFLAVTYIRQEKKTMLLSLLLAISWGSLLALNGWDFLIYTFVFGILLVLSYRGKTIRSFLKENIGIPSLIALVGVAIVSPMFMVLNSGKKSYLGPFMGTSNGFIEYWNHGGIWWLLIILLASYTVWRSIFKKKVPQINTYGALLIAIFFLILFAENFTFMDHMNTIFKTNNVVWVLLGIVALSSLRVLDNLKRLPKQCRLALKTGGILVAILLLCGTVFNIRAVTNFYPYQTSRPSLKGSEYLKKMNNSDYVIIEWIRKNIVGTPLLIESPGESFDHSSARISMHTGLPNFLGWRNHVLLRGISAKVYLNRSIKIKKIYNSTDALKIYELLLKQKVSLVMVGPIEKSRYNTHGLAKFEKFSNLFIPLIKEGKSTLYRVKGSL